MAFPTLPIDVPLLLRRLNGFCVDLGDRPQHRRLTCQEEEETWLLPVVRRWQPAPRSLHIVRCIVDRQNMEDKTQKLVVVGLGQALTSFSTE